MARWLSTSASARTMIAAASLRRMLLASLVVVPALAAQERTVQRHDFTEPEGRLIAYYSSALAFSPVGAPRALPPWTLELGGEATYVPPLSESQRRSSTDKPQATNLAPLLPRPRVALALPGDMQVEGSWVPPLRVFGVRANLLSLALSRVLMTPGPLRVSGRIVGLTGTIRGPITCGQALRDSAEPDLRFYYRAICNGRESDDRFLPRQLSGELLTTQSLAAMLSGRLSPYAGVGVRAERTRFDIGVINDDGSRDPDHPILELRAVRPYGMIGASWAARDRVRASGELFWAPGSVFTVRAAAAFRVRG